MVTKVLDSVTLHRLSPFRESNFREQQAGLRAGRGCVGQLFILRQLIEMRLMHRCPIVVVLLDLASTCSLGQTVLFNAFPRKRIAEEFANLL